MQGYHLTEILSELMNENETTFGRFIFSYDTLRNKVSQEQREELICKANECGINYADKVISDFGMHEGASSLPQIVAEKLKLKVHYKESSRYGEDFTFAYYESNGNITIFSEYIQKVKILIEKYKLNSTFGELPVAETLLAHEIFHYIEDCYTDTIFTRQFKIDLWKFKFFKNQSTIRSLSEIAAMSFAKRLTGLGYYPVVFDVLIGYSIDEKIGHRLYGDILGF